MTVILLLSLMLPTVIPALADSVPATLVKFDTFDGTKLVNGVFPASARTVNNASTTFALVGGVTSDKLTYPAGKNTASVSGASWTVGSTYWTTSAFSTQGYNTVTVTSYQVSSNTGPRDWSLQYSLDNTNWTNVQDYQVGSTSSPINWTPGSVQATLPAGAENQPTVYVRWLVSNNNNVGGTGTFTTTTGTSRISDITITGTPIPSDPGSPVSVTGVALDKNALTLGVSGTGTLHANVQPANATDQTVTWTSSDESVVTVANGTLTAVADGTATITATTEDGNFQASATVTVSTDAGKVTAVTLDKNTLSLQVGATGQLNSTVQPVTATDKSVTWTSSNANVATVDSTGKVTAMGAGSADITVTTADGGFTATAKVTVTTAAPLHAPGDVVLSQVYVNGGNSGAFYNQKFVELYNTTDQDIDLNGWSIGYTAAATSDATTMKPLSGTIHAHGYFLIGGGKGTTCTTQSQACAALPVTPDVDLSSGGLNVSGSTGGAIVLSQSTSAVHTADDPNIVDLFAYTNAPTTIFTHPLYWGQTFVSDTIGNGTIVRKTNVGSDPRSAYGLGNGWFSQTDESNNFVVFSPQSTSKPTEVVVRNSKFMEAPDASKITFDGNTTVTGLAASVPANADVTAYVNNGGTLVSAGHVTAGADGAFQMTITNSGNNQTVYVTHTTPYALKSVTTKVSVASRIDSSSYSKPATTQIGDLRLNDANGLPLNIGYSTTIEGVITSTNGSLGSEKTSFYLQDNSGGIEVISGTDLPSNLPVGEHVQVAGHLAFTAGVAQFAATSVTDLGAGTAVTPTTTTLDAMTSSSTAEPLEGKLVSVRGKVTNIPSTGPDYNVTITDDAGNLAIVKFLSTTGIDINTAVTLGETFTFTGIVGQSKAVSPFTSGYTILPRNAADVRGDLQFHHDALTKAYIGMDVPFTVTAKYADSVTLYYKNEGDSDYTALPMATADNLNYNVTIPQANVTAAKFYYYIVAQGGGKTLTSGDANTPNSVDVVDDKDGPAYSNETPANNESVESYHPLITDDLNDPSGVDVSTIHIAIDSKDFTAKASLSEKQVRLTLTSDDDLAVGPHTVVVTAKDMLGNASTDTWTFQVAERFTGGTHYRGTLHNHTNVSHDAAGAPEDALKAAKAHGYDFFAFSDHSHDIDSNLVGQDTVDHNGMPERTGGSNWQLEKSLAKQYTQDGSFVVFPAFEMTSTTWGHSNVFGTTNFIDRVQNGGEYQNLKNYYAWTLTYDNIVAQFNHPDMSANAFDNFIPYDKNVDKLFTLLEVGNGSGHYSYVNADEKFYSALDLGWHVAPTFGEDNHDATWGQTKKRTVIVAKDLSQDSLFDAMKNMHVYFSEDPKFQLDMLANGFYMGSTVDSKSLNFDITGSTPDTNDAISKAELITNGGRVVDTYTPSGNESNFHWQPSFNVVGGQQWFVVKVTQKDGDQIYSAPIWSPQDPLSVKVNDVSVVEGAAVAGIPVTLKADIANTGSINVSKLTAHFYYDSVDTGHLIGDTTIDALPTNQTQSTSITWANPLAGEHKIIVVLEAGDGNDLGDDKFEQALTVKAQNGVKVMIDATHSNENTTADTGTYTDNLKTFTLTLKQQGYTVVENKSTLTDQLLSDVKVLMITHPKSEYSASEIAVIKNFVDNGGSLLTTEKSNFGNTPQNVNSLLAGVGSSILVNDDGVFDETKDGNFWSTPLNSNFSVRLHNAPVGNGLTDFVPLLDFYSGASLAGNDGNGKKIPLTDSNSVTILAHGNDSTFQDSPQVKSDTVSYNVQTSHGKSGPALTDVTGGTAIPLVASEQLGNGRIVVAGMNIFNDKQMTQNDGPTNNVPFELNVVNWLSHLEPQVKTIGEARNLPDGTNVVVQGKVTTAAGVFYDAAYVQDDTGGIMAFSEVPAGSLQLGDTIRIYGHIGTFDHDKELMFDKFDNSIVKISSGTPVDPKQVTTGEATSDKYQGQLVQVKGHVTAIPDGSTYVLNDGSGNVTVFVDGYVASESGVPAPQLQVGDTLQAIGMSGKYAQGDRIRVRDTRELTKVTETTNVPVTGVSLNHSSLTLTVGAAAQTLVATIAPHDATNQAVTWTSSNEHVATVDASGHVTAVAAGTATITVTTVDGHFIATSTVTVKAPSNGGGGGGSGGNTGGNTGDNTGGGNGNTDDTHGKVTVTPDQITSSTDGNTNVEVPANTTEVDLPANTSDLLQQSDLEIKSDDLTMVVPSGLFKQLTGKLTNDEVNDSKITLKMTPLNESDSNDLLGKGNNASNANLKLDGKVYDFKLSISSASGKTIDLSTFDQPIELTFPVDPSIDPNLAGVYYIADDGTLEYIGGHVHDGQITAEVHHFSKYAVLEVTKQFTDIPAGYWATDVIQSLTAKQILFGTSTTQFEPERKITRAEFAAMLVRALKLTDKGTPTFTDVKANDWYADSVAIAANAGIVKGLSSTQFAPNTPITREEMVNMLMRAYELVHGQTTVAGQSTFADQKQISTWAADYVQKATALHLVNGVPGNKFDPKGIATRAQAAQLINNLLK